MKKTSIVLASVFALVLSSSPVFALAEDDFNYDTLGDWDIKIDVPANTIATLSNDGNYYIYTQDYGSIPYVLVRAYTDFEDEEDFVNGYFTDYMAEEYSDLEVVEEFQPVVIGDRDYYAIQYGYTVQGYDVADTRLVKTVNDFTYMFASKEIEELDMSVGDALVYVCENCVFLENGEPIEESELGSEGGTEEDPDLIPTDDGIEVIRWGDAESYLQKLGISGDFVTFDEAGYKMFLPETFHPSELPSGQPNPETFPGFYVSEDDEAYISVQLVPTNWSLEDYWEYLADLDDVNDPHYVNLNGTLFICYFLPSGGTICVATRTEDALLEFSFYPDSGDYVDLAEIVASSIQSIS